MDSLQKTKYKECLWNYWLQERRGVVTDDWMGDVWAVFNQIEKDADERFSSPSSWDKLGAKLKEETLTVDKREPLDFNKIVKEAGIDISPDIQETADEMESETIDTTLIPF